MVYRSVHAAIVRVREDVELLLNLRDQPTVWEFAGGMEELVDQGDPFKACLRETHEEVGIAERLLRESLRDFVIIPSEKFSGQGYLIYVFLLPADTEVLHTFTNSESRGNQFFLLTDLVAGSVPGNYPFIDFQRRAFLPTVITTLHKYCVLTFPLCA